MKLELRNWVFKAGAKKIVHPQINEVFPVYWDPIYLEKWCNFVKAFGEKYDDDPNVEFIQIGRTGWFGEMILGRTWKSGDIVGIREEWLNAGFTKDAYVEAYKKVLDAYIEDFQNKSVSIMLGNPMGDYDVKVEIVDYAVSYTHLTLPTN